MLEDHLEKLRYLHRIASEGSILKASKALGISQSALTKSILILESDLENTLFIRHRRGISLTETGMILFKYCQRLKHEIYDIEQKLKTSDNLSGSLVIGTYETLGVSYWPGVLEKLNNCFPNLKVSITTGKQIDIWNQLNNGSIDLIVDAEPEIKEQYYSIILYRDSFELFTKYNHTIKQNPIPFSYVKKAIDEQGKHIGEYLKDLSLNHQLIFDFDSFVSVDAFTKKGLAIGVLPLAFAKISINSKELSPFPSKSKHITFGNHRVCATCLESRRTDSRLIEIFKILKKGIKII